MANLDSKKTIGNLMKKGFQKIESKSDHIRLEFWHNGKATRIRTKLSHNGQDINDSLIGLMSKQIYLKNKQFIAFANCDVSQDEYIKILTDNKIPLE